MLHIDDGDQSDMVYGLDRTQFLCMRCLGLHSHYCNIPNQGHLQLRKRNSIYHL